MCFTFKCHDFSKEKEFHIFMKYEGMRPQEAVSVLEEGFCRFFVYSPADDPGGFLSPATPNNTNSLGLLKDNDIKVKRQLGFARMETM